jgi:ABC-2 type transport system permease protein
MLRDVWLVAMKEYREVLLRMGSLKANVFNIFLIVGVFGVFMPIQAGMNWVTRWYMALAYAWMPLFLVSALVADSFAGERERHTLETLLTTALSDAAILMGKLTAAVLYGYGSLIVVMVVGLVTVNISLGRLAHPVLYGLDLFLGVTVGGFLLTLLIAAVGVMVSLKAQTVRQAGQALSLGLLALIFLPTLVFGYAVNALPVASRTQLIEWLAQLNGWAVAGAAALVLLALDAVVLAIAARRFRRSRLVFD